MSDSTLSEPGGDAGLTEDDLKVTRSAAMRATALVSMAERGFFDQFKEAFAASRAVKAAPADVQRLMVGGMPSFAKANSMEELESQTLDLLAQAKGVLTAKAPNLLAGYRAAVVDGARDVAAAAKDTSPNEAAVITRIETALS